MIRYHYGIHSVASMDPLKSMIEIRFLGGISVSCLASQMLHKSQEAYFRSVTCIS